MTIDTQNLRDQARDAVAEALDPALTVIDAQAAEIERLREVLLEILQSNQAGTANRPVRGPSEA